MSSAAPLIDVKDISKQFGSVIALSGVSMAVWPGEVHCLLGDNGAGKSTLIKVLSGVHRPTRGELLLDGQPVDFGAPREALDAGIATVYQDLAMIPLMAIWRNFFLGAEPTRGWGPFRRFDAGQARRVTARASRASNRRNGPHPRVGSAPRKKFRQIAISGIIARSW